MYKTLRNRRLSYNVALLPPLCSGGTQVRHGAKMASETDAVLRFFCLAKEKIVEGEVYIYDRAQNPPYRTMERNFLRDAAKRNKILIY